MEYVLDGEVPDPELPGQKFVCITFVPHPEQNTMYFKIRGSYETFQEAQDRAIYLTSINPFLPIYVGEVGKFLPSQSHMINLNHFNQTDHPESVSIPYNIVSESHHIQDVEQTETLTTNNNKIECLACTDKSRNAVFLPCRHLVYCLDCSHLHIKQNTSCPICRTKISEIINIFTP